jgi:single-strand DNA-binding protein
MNTVLLTGRAVREAEVKMVGEHRVAKFTLAVERPFIKGKEKVTDYFKVECWNFWADKASKIVKGIKVFVSGSLKLNTWNDKTTGKKVYEVSVVANEVEPVWGAESGYPQANESSEPKIPADMLDRPQTEDGREVPV